MLQYDFQNSVGYWIHMTARMYDRVMHQELLPEGITHRQCQVLAWLAHEGELSQVDLADRMNIEPPTLVRILDRMERDGLIERQGCPGDRRRKIIRPLPAAQPVWRKLVECFRRVRERATRNLTAEQRRTLQELLQLVQANLSEDEGSKVPDAAARRPRVSEAALPPSPAPLAAVGPAVAAKDS
ncbi:MAG: MarR family transcriptional regulator [Planctomyces sp.]|nr:MarR family transcriptional regulator [Planctomyces sp.]